MPGLKRKASTMSTRSASTASTDMPGLKRTRSSTKGDASPSPAKRAQFNGGAAAAGPFPTGPGGPMEIVFSFDTTGSMSSCLMEVRKNLTNMISRLQKDIPGLRIAVFAHGDYCDVRNYVTKYVDFTTDVTKLVDFVNNVSSTGGGDSDECYELVLYEVRTKLSWSPGTQRSLVMIGDANPHGVSYPENTLKLDWKKETDKLAAEAVHIYGVNCSATGNAVDFYKSLASKTDGKYLELKAWDNIFDMMMAICYREHGADFFMAYEHEVRSRGPAVSHEVDAMLRTLRHSDDDDGSDSDGTTGAAATTCTTAVPVGLVTPTKTKKPSLLIKKKLLPALKKKTTTTKPLKKKPSAVKTKPTAVKKVFRERLGKHPLASSLDWSRWQLMISNAKPTNRLAKKWIPARSGAPGFRRIGLFNGETQKPAIYEVGVKLPESRKISGVYFRPSNGFELRCHLDTYLFRHEHLTAQINDVVNNKCDVYIRRAVLPPTVDIDGAMLSGPFQIRDYVRKHVEYAWNKRIYGKRRHRVVIKKGIRISSDKF
ncbi:uncharacterized protein LOC135484751 [Lineus longissimus]|uniref:uncharacterized protein LOC135484751 n=1 Tax=Lineus longissimus TaxID=88925 RepID=UPI002B4CA1AF